MNIEEKALAYDHAVNYAKMCYGGDRNTDAAIKYMFPEMFESEDERIIKKLQEYVKNRNWPLNGPTQEEVLAWLEKQKKQKLVDYEPVLKFKVGDKIHLIDGTSPNYEDDCITIGEIDTVNYIGEFKEGYVPIKEQVKWELAKKQKPTATINGESIPTENNSVNIPCRVWSDEDEKKRKFLIKGLEDRMGFGWASDPFSREDLISWLEDLGPQLENYDPVDVLNKIKTEWPMAWEKVVGKQEWSEEDKNFIKELCNLLVSIAKNNYVGRYYAPDLVNKLQSLRPVEQEWSEEEKTSIEYLNLLCDRELRNGCQTKSEYEVKQGAKNFLNSLKPQYTPKWSDEDEDFINMLILHFNYLIDKGGDSVETYKSYIEKLKSLRPQPQPHTVSIKDATKFGNLEYERGVKDGIQHAENHQCKPSEEQMTALKECGECKRCIKELYENLQKRYGTC